jgi:hypothetical protein
MGWFPSPVFFEIALSKILESQGDNGSAISDNMIAFLVSLLAERALWVYPIVHIMAMVLHEVMSHDIANKYSCLFSRKAENGMGP